MVVARRYYWIDGVAPERVRVTGWQDLELGTGSKEWPLRAERWCRVRFEGRRVSTMLCHPSRLREEMPEAMRLPNA